jgi:hypothetical protein
MEDMFMKKYGFVYIWFDRKRKMFYVGSHWGSEGDGYICSSNRMRKAYRRRPQDFKRKIIKVVNTNRTDLLEEEYKFLSLIPDADLGKRYYNLTNHKNGHWSSYPEKAKSLKEKISIKTKEAMWRDDVREKYLDSLKTRDNRSSEPEVREKRSKSMIGKNTEEWKWKENLEKAHESLRGKTLTEEHKQKVRDAGVFKSLNSQKISCIHCGKTGNVGSINRWHNNNCKNKVS